MQMTVGHQKGQVIKGKKYQKVHDMHIYIINKYD